ncbi:MAG: DUF5615 family PIN-like protein [Planctomycetota bacterium]
MSIRVKIDEDLPVGLAELVLRAGYDVATVRDQNMLGATDEELWAEVQRERRLLITADKALADARMHPVGTHSGVVLLRLPVESGGGYVRALEILLQRGPLDELTGAIAVVTPGLARIRYPRH